MHGGNDENDILEDCREAYVGYMQHRKRSLGRKSGYAMAAASPRLEPCLGVAMLESVFEAIN